MAAAGTPLSLPAPAPSISHSTIGKVRNNIGHALNGGIASADSAPAASARPRRFQPQAKMIAAINLRSLSAPITADRLHRRATGSHGHWPEGDSARTLLAPALLARGAGPRAGSAQAGVPCAERCGAA